MISAQQQGLTNTNHAVEQQENLAALRLFNRPPRILGVPPANTVEIPGPPQRPAARMTPRLLAIAIPLVTALIYFMVAFGRSAQGGSFWFSLPIVLLSAISAGAAYGNYRTQRRLQAEAEVAYSQNYAQALERTRLFLQQLEAQQRECYENSDPDLPALLAIVTGEDHSGSGVRQPDPRLWERRPGDDDFLQLRVGRGDRASSVAVKPPNMAAYAPDAERGQELAEQFQAVANVPLTVSLRALGSLGVAGPGGRALDVLRALLWQIAVHHAPSEVRIAAFWDSAFDSSWEWLRWLPHTRSLDGDSSYRLLARYDRNPEELAQVLGALAKELRRRGESDQPTSGRPHLIVVISDYQRHGGAYGQLAACLGAKGAGISGICLVPAARDVPGACGGYLDLSGGSYSTLAVAGPGGGYRSLRVDGADLQQSGVLARLLAPVELCDSGGSREMPRNVPLLPLLGIDDAQSYNPQTLWAQTPAGSWHPVPVGRQSTEALLELDLNEGAHGVHGMIAGATGAGKSELLLSFLIALAIRHHPDRLNFMLIDFKGGATFRDLEGLPHTAGFVTDLSGFLAQRALIAMNSELDRRKRRLNEKGVPNIRSYRRAGLDIQGQHIPNLLIAIDEFDEMIRDYPDFQLELVRIAKQGRSLGVHLLFATQQPSLIKEGLLNNLSYWMSLRVNSKDDSKAMVGLPDAATLGTDLPGRGFFRDKNSGVRLFQSALITATYQPSAGRSSSEVDVTGRQRLITDELRLRHSVRRLLAQLVEDLRDALTDLRRRQITEQAAADLERQLGQALALAGPDQQQEQQECITQGLQEFLLALSGLQFDANRSSEAEAIERQLDSSAEELLRKLRGEQQQRSEIELVAGRMAQAFGGERYAARNYPIWADPLPALLPLLDVLASQRSTAWLSVPIGSIDRPEEARAIPLVCDLPGAGGNLLALGASGSGKTTLLRTLLLALADCHSPGELWCYTLDSAGSGLGLRGKLPHLADTLAYRQHDSIERLMVELQEQVERRRALFQQHSITTISQYRGRYMLAGSGENGSTDNIDAAGEQKLPAAMPAILVAIDNLAELIGQNEALLEGLKTLMREGRSYGIYFAVTAYSMRDVAPLAATCETKLALRLNSDDDSVQLIGKDFASKLISADQPGRGFMRGSPRPVELQIALPTLRRAATSAGSDTTIDDTSVAYSDLGDELDAAAASIRRHWQSFCLEQPHRLPQPLQLLPSTVSLVELKALLPAATSPAHAAALGIEGSSLKPLAWQLNRTAHLLISGSLRSGKSTLLRTILWALTQAYSCEEIELVLVDFSLRTLGPLAATRQTRRFVGLAVGKEQRDIDLIGEREELLAAAQQLSAELAERSKGIRGGGTLGKRTVLALSNWDLICDPQVNAAMLALEQYARRGSEVGLHVIVTNSDFGTAGAGLIKSLRTSCAEAVLGRPPEGGAQTPAIARRFKAALSTDLPVGRGFLLEAGQPARIVQFVRQE